MSYGVARNIHRSSVDLYEHVHTAHIDACSTATNMGVHAVEEVYAEG